MGGLELLLLGLLPLGLLALLPESGSDGDTGEDAPPEEPRENADAQDLLDSSAPAAPPDPATADDIAAPPAEDDIAPASAIWPEEDWPTNVGAEDEGAEVDEPASDWPDPNDPAPEPPAQPAEALPASETPEEEPGRIEIAVAGGEAGTGPEETTEDAQEYAREHGAAEDRPEDYRPKEDWSEEDWPEEDWPEFALAPRPGADGAILGTRGADTLAAGDVGAEMHANWTPDLATPQGSDLFVWRDDGQADTLAGGAGDDRLILARGDTATGGGGANVFEVWNDPGSPQPPALLTDFTPGTDRLDIVTKISEAAHPDCGAWEWDRGIRAAVFQTAQVEILRDPVAGLTEIRVNGTAAAHLAGTPAITEADLRLLAFWDVRS
jgi:hypothetical protein